MTEELPARRAMHVQRDDLSVTELIDESPPTLGDGQALLRVDVVGLSANNVTYAVLGEQFHYWDFSPRPRRGARSRSGDSAGRRLEPPRSRRRPPVLRLLPVRQPPRRHPRSRSSGRLQEVSQHRAHLPSPYNTYDDVADDHIDDAHLEHLHALYRPLFWTSFMLADRVIDADPDEKSLVVMTSASSKTAYITAFLLHRAGRRVVGLRSARNVAFTNALRVYDEVLTYDDVTHLAAEPTTVLDFLGDDDVDATLSEHLGEHHSRVIVGVTGQVAGPDWTLEAIATEAVFFAPTQMKRRLADWGREELERRYQEAWTTFVAEADGFVDVVVASGLEALQEGWHEIQAGRVDPRDGMVFTLGT